MSILLVQLYLFILLLFFLVFIVFYNTVYMHWKKTGITSTFLQLQRSIVLNMTFWFRNTEIVLLQLFIIQSFNFHKKYIFYSVNFITFTFTLLVFISVLVILVHQVKLNKIEKCCLGN